MRSERARRLVSAVRLAAAALSCALLAIGLGASTAAAGPDYFHYQVFFPTSPLDGDEAALTFDARASAMIRAVACGDEAQFGLLMGGSGEGITAIITGKIEWLAGSHGSDPAEPPPAQCQFSRKFLPYELCPYAVASGCDQASVVDAFAKSAWYLDLQGGDFSALNDNLKIRYSPFCRFDPHVMQRDGVIVASGLVAPNDSSDQVRIDFAVGRDCMRGQINAALESMKVDGQMGTDKAPCHGKGILAGEGTHGDWDMTVRNLTRIVYLDDRYGRTVLNPVVRDHIENDLLTADGPPADPTYPLWGCGNTQESTGTSQDRADERGWVDDVGDWLKDNIPDWLKYLLVVFVFFAVAAAVAAAVGGAIGLLAGAAAGALAAAAVGLLASANIPETENHLLMINSSKYLKNQQIIVDLGWDSDGAARYRQDQLALRAWLLSHMQRYVTREFIEYNSRPYHRLSIVALLNIADFANDDDLRTGAHIVLDYTTAKFDVGSSQGRRFVPFRRLRGTLATDIFDVPFHTNGIFDLVRAGDVQVAMGLLFAGQTQQLNGSFISFGAAEAAIYFATSPYRPEPFVTDLAIRKAQPVYQRVQYDAGEIYSSERSFLISAGGIATAQAYSGTGIEALDQLFSDKVKGDRGLALPTTLFLTGAPQVGPIATDRTTLYDVIRIEGRRPDEVDYPSFDHNLCVWQGFACGTNVIIPEAFAVQPPVGTPPCMVQVPSGSNARWNFIDTSICIGYQLAPRSFIAIYRQDCPQAATDCDDNFGFFEVVDVSSTAQPNNAFDLFKMRVIAANPTGFISPFTTGLHSHRMGGSYHSERGQVIRFSADAHQHDNSATGIIDVDGVEPTPFGAWGFASGEVAMLPGVTTPITSSVGGYVDIANARLGRHVELDFRDAQHPVRTVH